MASVTYPTLDDALADIAERSFSESARVHRVDGGGYVVEDWHTDVEESTEWSYKDGATIPGDAIDYSRTHEPYEFYGTAAHIRYNLHHAVAALETGEPVAFTYVIAEAACEDDNPECPEDHAVGWLLVATPA